MYIDAFLVLTLSIRFFLLKVGKNLAQYGGVIYIFSCTDICNDFYYIFITFLPAAFYIRKDSGRI